jgi:HEAT repeat protein
LILRDNGRVAKASSTEDALLAIRRIRDAPDGLNLTLELRPFLKHKSNHVIAAAADTAGRFELGSFCPAMVEAFLELMTKPATRDPGCKALIAIAKALAAMDQQAPEVYFKGIRHVQKEASFGPPVDAAAPLRGVCAQGLVRINHPDALLECVTLLADPEVEARAGAVRALGESGQSEGMLLLRLKALLGDSGEIMSECFASLLRLAPAPSLDFVSGFLKSSSEEIADRAALALGESQIPAAFGKLRESWEQTVRPSLRRTLLLGLALLRRDEALEFLINRLEEDTERASSDALAALALYARDDSVRDRIDKIVTKRKSAALRAVFEKEFKR